MADDGGEAEGALHLQYGVRFRDGGVEVFSSRYAAESAAASASRTPRGQFGGLLAEPTVVRRLVTEWEPVHAAPKAG